MTDSLTSELQQSSLYAVFATDANHNTWRVSDPADSGATHYEWDRLDTLRREGRLPQARFFEVRTVTLGPDRPLVGPEVRSHDRYDRAQVGMHMTTEVLAGSKGHKNVEDAAHKAWLLWTDGVYRASRRSRYTGEVVRWEGTQGVGGWFYYPNGQTAAQGKADLARVAQRRNLVLQGVDGRWYVAASVVPVAA